MEGANKLPQHSINNNIIIPSFEGMGGENKLPQHSINNNITIPTLEGIGGANKSPKYWIYNIIPTKSRTDDLLQFTQSKR